MLKEFIQNTRIQIALGVGIILIFHTPFLFLGESSHVVVHDNLDGEFMYLHILKLTNNLFGFSGTTVVNNIFNGISRENFHSEFSFIRVIFYFSPILLGICGKFNPCKSNRLYWDTSFDKRLLPFNQ